MKPETEEFLHLLLWSAEILVRPTFSNLRESYEGWVYRHGLLRGVSALEKRQLIERDSEALDERVYRLTAQGRLHVLGGRDPQACWSRDWDGRWRMVLFDVPVGRDSERKRLRRYLRDRGFGCLQNSVWISPDPLEPECRILLGAKIDVESFILLEARPCAGESDQEIVAGAWDFARINCRYRRLLKILDERPKMPLRDTDAAETLRRWGASEREAWLDAVTNDPLLPEPLLPSDYLGQKAWRRRIEVLREAGRQLRAFKR
jgi:phenylacetic acid degradation operon negative regulatory protein